MRKRREAFPNRKKTIEQERSESFCSIGAQDVMEGREWKRRKNRKGKEKEKEGRGDKGKRREGNHRKGQSR